MTVEPAARHATISRVSTPMPNTSRCDKCGAQAWVEVELPERIDLNFCAHHYKANEDRLFLTAVRIIDHTDYLLHLEKHNR